MISCKKKILGMIYQMIHQFPHIEIMVRLDYFIK